MNRNIKALLDACTNMNLSYEIHHDTNNLVSVHIGSNRYLFVNWTTPLNPQSIIQLCADKYYFYSFFQDVIRMPNTSSFFYPYTERHTTYLQQKTIYEIIKEVEEKHIYPLIIKKNRGFSGRNIFKVCNRRELEKGLLQIFNINSASFDYVSITQDYIDIDREFRVVYLNGEYQFAYEKNVGDAVSTGNLNPRYWEGAKARLLQKQEDIDVIKNFCSPIFDKLAIPFCGFDIAVDHSGEFWLLEANSSPMFDYIIEHEGDGVIIELYQNILSCL